MAPSTELLTRPYRGAADLRAMQDRLSRDVDNTSWRPGDLAWAAREHTHRELSLLVTLLTHGDSDDIAGWTWVWNRGLVDVHLDPALRDQATYERLLAAGEDTVRAMADAGDDVTACATTVEPGDDALLAAVQARGYAPDANDLQVNRRELTDLPSPIALPPGWRTAAVDSDALVDGRVECHRAAFAPSSLTVEKYRRVRRTRPYRADLDRVILDADGAVAASCTAWLDEATGHALLEPVSTHPHHQGRGYGRAVCIDALHALRRAGGRSVQVGCEAGSRGCATYESVGFVPQATVTGYRRPL